MIDLATSFSTFGGLVVLNVAVTEAVVKACKVTKNWAKQLISWVLPVVLSIVGFVFQFGIFAEYGLVSDWYGWVYTILTGLCLGLASNGVYDIEGVEQFLEWVIKLLTKKKDTLALTEEDDELQDPDALVEETPVVEKKTAKKKATKKKTTKK